MTVQQYDEIGEAYEGFKTLPLARYPELGSFLRMLGNLTGKSVLDLACGTGFYTRQAKRLGAADVLGVDVSAEMVAAARAIEERTPMGVRYEVADGAELPRFERPFDAATAVYLLNYADDPAAMERMCRGVHRSLRPGGEFFVLTQAPGFRFDGPSTDKYGFRYVPEGESAVGTQVRITALLDPPIEFLTHYPRRDVYEGALTAAGFSEVTWVPLSVPEDGVKAYGPEFWEDFLANPPLEMLRCRA
ncbi:class I SAM-dependent methyltransferase [Streptomyces sp. NPDC020379]|uniref:class I SAM-dependent methyltransferase n=1 Tax=Streptomyces sp. NPDC020379 TaxID=3365071 RepID=UPI00378CC2D8